MLLVTVLSSTLLVLTQTHFVPDLSQIWQPGTTVAERTNAGNRFQLPVKHTAHFDIAMIREEDKEKINRVLRRGAAQTRELLKTKKQAEVFSRTKRYLLFGQLRADG